LKEPINKNSMEFNFLTTAIAALIPLIMGFIWYGPMLFQKAWMKEMGFTEESLKGGNMALIFGLSYVLNFFNCRPTTNLSNSSVWCTICING